MPRGFSVVAIVAAYNEADIITAVVRDLIDQDISVYFLDDGSTDGTVQAVEQYEGRGVVKIERLRGPVDGASTEFAWAQILRRKAQLATELDADWFIHHDADEFRESPWADVPLKEAIRRVDEMGYNAIDFASLDFRPTDNGFREGDVRVAFPFYSEGAPYDKVQIRCWKKTDRVVELASTGGHEARFEGRTVFPIRFISRHYPIRGQSHGDRKVFAERKPRFVDDERVRGWHVQYDDLVEGTSFVHDPCALTRFDPIGVRIDLSLRHRGVEALEQSLVGLQAEHDAARADIERLTVELDDFRAQLAQRVRELTGLTSALEQRDVEVANLQTGIADFMNQLEAFRRSLSWRWTAPARAVYRLLTGRS
jgi:glycosyl transferase family 2